MTKVEMGKCDYCGKQCRIEEKYLRKCLVCGRKGCRRQSTTKESAETAKGGYADDFYLIVDEDIRTGDYPAHWAYRVDLKRYRDGKYYDMVFGGFICRECKDAVAALDRIVDLDSIEVDYG